MQTPAVVVFLLAQLSSCNAQHLFSVPACNYTVEIMFLQDYSDSSAQERQILKPQYEEVLEAIDSTFANSRTGFASFVDKPITPLGYDYQGPWFEGDWCLSVVTDLDFEGTPQDQIDEIMANQQPGGGDDFPENQLGALHDIAKSDTLAKWSSAEFNEYGQRVRRVVVLSTDSAYHIAGDGQSADPAMTPNDGSPETNCTHEDYPTIAQVREGLEQRDIYMVFLAADGHVGKDVVATYEELLSALGTPGGVYAFNTVDGNLMEVMIDVMRALGDEVCDATVDVMYSQDVTWSYNNDRVDFRNGMSESIDNLNLYFKSSRFGLTSFGDKPLGGFGDGPSGDYCVKLDQSLTDDTNAVEDAALNLPGVSGLDWRESQLDALITTARDEDVGWRNGNQWEGMNLYRIIVLSTDAGFHYAPDAANAGFNLDPHPLLPINKGDCISWEYPTSDQVAQVLAAEKIMPVFVPTSDLFGKYSTLINEWKTNFDLPGAVVKLDDFGDWTGPTTKAIRRLVREDASRRRLSSF